MLPVMENSALFVTLKNIGTQDHAITSAGSRAAEVVELHTHVSDGEFMCVRQVERIDVKAVRIAHPVHTMQDVVAAGGTVYVCGGCLKRAGFGPDDLMDGVQIGHPDTMIPAICEPDAEVVGR